jgi:FixJ family two-component response regulator
MQARCASAVDASVVVIVIDDDLALRNSLKFAFEIEGFSVRVYRDGPSSSVRSSCPAAAVW